jgi:hypothetical protein
MRRLDLKAVLARLPPVMLPLTVEALPGRGTARILSVGVYF